MQKNIIALAIAAACAAPVSAMAAVTVYGTMDGGLRHQTSDYGPMYDANANKTMGGTTNSLQMGQYNTGRWGFKSVEDMGDGMKTNVVLETSLTPAGVGAGGTANADPRNPYGLIFDRQATLGLSGGMGSFDMGWNYTNAWKTVIAFDPFAGKFNDITYVKPASAGVRSPNLTFAGKLGDVALSAQYVMNNAYGNSNTSMSPTNNPSFQEDTGAGRSLSAIYASGPVSAGLSYTAFQPNVLGALIGTKIDTTCTTATNCGSTINVLGTGVDSSTHIVAGAGFDYGAGKVSVGYAKKTTAQTVTTTGANPTTGDKTATDIWLGASYNVSSAVTVTGGYYKNTTNSGKTTGVMGQTDGVEGKKTRMMVAATYALSKATSLYVEADTETANYVAKAPFLLGTTLAEMKEDAKTTGFSFGLSTAF